MKKLFQFIKSNWKFLVVAIFMIFSIYEFIHLDKKINSIKLEVFDINYKNDDSIKLTVNSIESDVSSIKSTINSTELEVSFIKRDIDSIKWDISSIKSDLDSIKTRIRN